MEMDAPSRSIFWGLVVKPGKRYETEVQEPFRITKACMELSTAGEKGKVSSLIIECDNNEEFIIANLSAKVFNETLDLAFNEGEKICFKVDGPGTVHLTGNLMDDPQEGSMMEGMDMMGSESEASEEESEAEEAGDRIKEVVEKGGKRKGEEAGQAKAKKAKVEESEEESDDEEESEDEDNTSTEADTTANATTGDDEDDSDDDDDSDDEEEEEEAPKAVEKKTKADVKVDEPAKEDVGVTPKSSKKQKIKEAVGANTPKIIKEAPKESVKTPKAEAKTPKAEAKTPKAEAKTPKAEAKTPKVEAKTPKAEAKTPKDAPKTPKEVVKAPKEEPKTPKEAAKTPKVESKTPKQDAKTPKDAATPGKTPKRMVKGGVSIEELQEGTGPECKAGNMVGMFYNGKLKSNNKQFDACESGKPFKFKLGSGQVIKGWDVGVLGLKVGGKRRITVPAPMGYGKEGSPPEIPPNSTLVFDVECKFVK